MPDARKKTIWIAYNVRCIVPGAAGERESQNHQPEQEARAQDHATLRLNVNTFPVVQLSK